MSASAVKPVHPTTGTQAPLVGSGAPSSGPGNSPPLPATGGAKIQPNTTGSPVKPAVTNTNHSVTPAIPVGFVQDHKAGGNGLTQPQVPLQRTPEKNKDLAVGSPVVSKPTSNGVEGNEDPLATPTTEAALEVNPEEVDTLTNVQNHADETLPLPEMPVQQLGVVSTTVAEVPPELTAGSQLSPTKGENASPTTTNVSSPFGSLNNVGDSALDVLGTSSPELTAPELVPALSPANVPQLPSSTTDVSPTPASVSQAFVLDTPPKLTPVQPDAGKPLPDVPKTEFKVATPPRNSKRKKDSKLETEMKELSLEDNIDRKSKRQRTQTQPYQSPLPELTYMSKFKPVTKSDSHDRLIVFYRNEFLAVRNADGSFYVCQATQNIYKSSGRVRIRWLSQEKKEGRPTDVYIPDFYDFTDFDCILTNLDLKKLDKNKYQLPPEERDRTLNILNRALDVEKGIADNVAVTEEHPDGLDLSLYRDEAQLKKKTQPKKSVKKSVPMNSESTEESDESLGDDSIISENDSKKPKSKVDKKVAEKTKSISKDKNKGKERESTKIERTPERERGRDRGTANKRSNESASRSSITKLSNEKRAKLATPEKKAKAAPPKARKSTTVSETAGSPIPTRSTKSRSGPKDTPKASPLTRTKERERRAVTVKAKERKLPGKKGKPDSD